ncbi:MAG: DNA mismatch repair endonuclease MutL [Bacteroidia bacterium]
MSDIIKLLPDSVANQIAAGEVIQRPASAVKELLENAIDAGADTIKLIIKDAGKTLVQVIDNGCGMSETDARMSFERHATSKLNTADDLFNIRTKGFRGEALASIAAVAQVAMFTRRYEDETGTLIEVEGSSVKNQQQVATPAGTSFLVKNLFFNVPARRNFLKSNAQETRHIIEEFQRAAMPHHNINFTMHHDGLEVFNLKAGNFRQRICGIFGANFNERLVPIEEETNIVHIGGFIGKPEFAKKIRGEQYFFVNNRFIRDNYLNHAVNNGFEDMLPKDCFPSYFIKIDIDPSKIDVNIHPTKTEIKFEDDKSIYAIIRAAVKRALGKFSIAPSLDFETESNFEVPLSQQGNFPKAPQIKINPDYNPFNVERKEAPTSFPKNYERTEKRFSNWEKLYSDLDKVELPETNTQQELSHEAKAITYDKSIHCFQLYNKYIAFTNGTQLIIVNQQAAHERIIFEKNINAMHSQKSISQQQLFPQTFELNAEDFELMSELADDLKLLGFDLNIFGTSTYVIHGTPSYVDAGKEIQLLESLLDQFKMNSKNFRIDKQNSIAKNIARSLAVKEGTQLDEKEMKHLLEELFQCAQPERSVYGGKVFVTIDDVDVDKKFAR